MHSYNEYKDYVNEHLTDYIPEVNPYANTIKEAMCYSLEGGGKRLRPVLLLAACELFGGDIAEALPYACALEYIHTYSLIHDDLPAMDNDDYRRGKLTNHKVYGEAMAILAGDGLLNTAAELMSKEMSKYYDKPSKLTAHAKANLAILEKAGIHGMIAGQVADVENENTKATSELVDYIDANKTGALIIAPILAGMYIAEASEEDISNFADYAAKIGKAFQISDDILDIEGDAALIGKSTGKDIEEGKCNYACVHGIDAAKAKLHELTIDALGIVEKYGEKAEFFANLAKDLEKRKA